MFYSTQHRYHMLLNFINVFSKRPGPRKGSMSHISGWENHSQKQFFSTQVGVCGRARIKFSSSKILNEPLESLQNSFLLPPLQQQGMQSLPASGVSEDLFAEPPQPDLPPQPDPPDE